MRLVGATRWFIRWPFMIEGVVVGFVGGLVAILILWLGKITIVDPLSSRFSLPRGAEQQHALASRPWSRSSSPPRWWSRRSAPASRCVASSRSEAGVKTRGAVAFGVALVAALVAGLWLGGHPAKLPEFLRDRFVGSTGGLTAEAAEVIEDNYYRPVGNTELGNASLQGMVRELRKRHDDRFTDYFSPESLESFNQQIEGHFSGIGLSVVAGQARAAGGHGLPRLARRGGRDRGRRHDRLGRRRSIAGVSSTDATEKIKGPEGTEVTVGVLDAEERQGPPADADPGRGGAAQRQQPDQEGRRPQARLRAHAQLQRRRPRAARRRGRKGRRAKGRRESSSTCAATRGGLLDEAVLSASLFLPEDEVVVSTKSRTQGDSVHETSAATCRSSRWSS